MIRGLPITERAMVMRWLSPPDRTAPLVPTMVIMPIGMLLISFSTSAIRTAVHTSSLATSS